MVSQMMVAQVGRFLNGRFDPAPSNLKPLSAGMFSQAFAFEAGPQRYVIRINAYSEDFAKDAYASRYFAGTRLPIPQVVELGRIDDHYFYCITTRCPSQTHNTLSEAEVLRAAPSLFAVLDAIHAIDVTHLPGWGLTDAHGNGRFPSWRAYLQSFYNQKFDFTWPQLIKETLLEERVFTRFYAVFTHLLPFCPQQKRLVHGDFGFDNVLVADGQVSGVLDWAEWRLGDPLYDVAYLDFWSRNLRYGRLWVQERNVTHFAERMACYWLHIGLSSLAIAAIHENEREYTWLQTHIKAGLHRYLPGQCQGLDSTAQEAAGGAP